MWSSLQRICCNNFYWHCISNVLPSGSRLVPWGTKSHCSECCVYQIMLVCVFIHVSISGVLSIQLCVIKFCMCSHVTSITEITNYHNALTLSGLTGQLPARRQVGMKAKWWKQIGDVIGNLICLRNVRGSCSFVASSGPSEFWAKTFIFVPIECPIIHMPQTHNYKSCKINMLQVRRDTVYFMSAFWAR